MKQNENKTFTVMRFEFGNYLRSKFFIISTLIICALILVGMSVPKISSFFQKGGAAGASEKKQAMEIVNETDFSLDTAAIEEAMPGFSLREADYTSEEEMFQALEERDLEGILQVRGLNDARWVTRRLQLDQSTHNLLADQVFSQMKFQTFERRGIPAEEAAELVSEPRLEILEAAMLSGKSQTQTQWYTYALVMILYMTIMSYGQMTASSVASEKSTRAMELLVTSTKPSYLIYGKVLGTGLAGLLQMLLIGLTYFVAFRVNRGSYAENNFLLNALKMPAVTFFMAVITFILSYLAYAFLFAALGSLVNRSEEVSQVVSPIMMLYMGVILLSLFATFFPEQIWVTILSFVPLVGTLIMFVRFSMLELPLIQFVIALLIHTATVMVCARVAVSIYRNGILRYGKAPRLREVVKLIRKQKI